MKMINEDQGHFGFKGHKHLRRNIKKLLIMKTEKNIRPVNAF